MNGDQYRARKFRNPPFDWLRANGFAQCLPLSIRTVVILLALLFAHPAWAAESGTALKADALRAEPFADAKEVAALAAGDKVEILKKNGGWLQVKSARGSGWVRMLSIRKGEARKGPGDAAGLLALASGRAGTGKVVATTGIRGLNEEELKSAKFNEPELKLAESFATSKADAQKFAVQGKLAARKFDYLAAPQ
ncbi:MAG: SH3 domain-containing protein [Nitrosomonadales bacterium]|nr:SH3 domain-containing protein [Nitrosomonadales bacterium]